MILVEKILGNTGNLATNKTIDLMHLEWFETNKPIQRKRTAAGVEVALKFVREGIRFQQGDILWENETTLIVVDILQTEAIVITPSSLVEMGTICYEIGNKHLPLFIEKNQVLVPYEAPLFRLLEVTGYQPTKEIRRLQNMLKANVTPHAHGNAAGSSLFSKILKLTT